MEIITFDSEAFKEIITKIDDLENKIETALNRPLLGDDWLDIQDTCKLLKLSKRTLQTYRDRGIIGYSQYVGKVYIRASDIKAHLEKHYIKAIVDH